MLCQKQPTAEEVQVRSGTPKRWQEVPGSRTVTSERLATGLCAVCANCPAQVRMTDGSTGGARCYKVSAHLAALVIAVA
jgi:hypothetical protein